MDVIASRKNPFVAAVRRVAEGDDRDRVLLDGLHLLEEARSAQVPIASAAFTARALAGVDGKARRLATALAGTGVGASIFLIRRSSARCLSLSSCSRYIVGMAKSNRTNSMSINAAKPLWRFMSRPYVAPTNRLISRL